MIKMPDGRDLEKDLAVIAQAFYQNVDYCNDDPDLTAYVGSPQEKPLGLGWSPTESILELLKIEPPQCGDPKCTCIPGYLEEDWDYAEEIWQQLAGYLRKQWELFSSMKNRRAAFRAQQTDVHKDAECHST